jgi:PT repeat
MINECAMTELIDISFCLSISSLIDGISTQQTPSNYQCINAIDIPNPLPLQYFQGNTTDVAFDDTAGDGLCVSYVPRVGLWYKISNGPSSIIDIVSSTCARNTQINTTFSVFKGNSCTSLTCVAYDDKTIRAKGNLPCGYVYFQMNENTTYYVLAEGASISVKGIVEVGFSGNKVTTKAPTKAPTKSPTKAPTKSPTKSPTNAPTKAPTKSPTKAPTKAPVPILAPVPVPAPVKAPVPVPVSVAPFPPPCGLFGWSIFCPRTGCGLVGRWIGICRR